MHDTALLQTALDDLLPMAATARAGTRITYSPKVFIPLTTLCRDRCGYCTFAQSPARAATPYLEPAAVLRIATAGARAGCHEALFTLGERPELRYTVARDWLRDHGYVTTVEYLAAMCRLVLDETGLLPHANAGALTADELAALRPVSASQGMMLETLNGGLECHRNAPDKTPARRLATLEAAGALAIPFTTGILVGIGESRQDRLDALRAIAASHLRHGHVQEVIVQNFLPKPLTPMRGAPAAPSDDYRWTLAAARVILPPDVHLQAPPNLSDDFGALLATGIDDWGGVSPVTADHVNPERPWPDLDVLRDVTEAHGLTLAPRLTIYPERALDAARWLDPALHFPVLDRSDAEGLGRDDPGAHHPERVSGTRDTGDGAEVVLVGARSTAWYSGAPVAPPVLVPSAARAGGAVGEVLDGVRAGQEPGIDELVTLFGARGQEVAAVAALADELRAATVGDTVTWVHNRNINYTNVCTFKCRFCGFSKGPLSLNLRGKPYLLTLDDIAARVAEAWDRGATEVTLQGGIHPSFDGDYYIDVTHAVKAAAPDIHVHGFTALEVTEGAKRLGEPLAAYLTRLRDAGLGSLPGTAAEILDDEIRAVLCPDKITTDEWLEAHETAHAVGLRSNVTIMFGAVEQPVHWARHLVRTRELQRRTGGFTEFVPLPFVHMAAPIYLQRRSRRGPTFRETVLMHAIGRIGYHGLIDNIQASWVKIGGDGSRQLLQAGVNDLGGTLMDENISRAAGAAHGQGMEPDDFAALVAPLGRPLAQRTTLYRSVEPVAVSDGAVAVVAALEALRSDAELAKVRTRLAPDEPAIGVRMGDLFATAKAHTDLDLAAVDELLAHPAYEPRMAAFCILDFKARRTLDVDQRAELCARYLDHHDRITTWDMVDRAAPRVVGGYLAGRSKAPLHELAAATDPLRRRTAITAPLFFVKAGSDDDVAAGFAIAALLVEDPEPVVRRAVGIFLKHAGRRQPEALEAFLRP